MIVRGISEFRYWSQKDVSTATFALSENTRAVTFLNRNGGSTERALRRGSPAGSMNLGLSRVDALDETSTGSSLLFWPGGRSARPARTKAPQAGDNRAFFVRLKTPLHRIMRLQRRRERFDGMLLPGSGRPLQLARAAG